MYQHIPQSTSNSSLIVRIRDSVIPVISITSELNDGIVTEGEKFEFLISADPAPIEPISVEFTAVDVYSDGSFRYFIKYKPSRNWY